VWAPVRVSTDRKLASPVPPVPYPPYTPYQSVYSGFLPRTCWCSVWIRIPRSDLQGTSGDTGVLW